MASLKSMKAQVVCNKARKKQFVQSGAMPQLLDVLQKEKHSEVGIQAAQMIGSLCTIQEGVKELVGQRSGVDTVVKLLLLDCSPQERGVDVVARKPLLWILRLLCQEGGHRGVFAVAENLAHCKGSIPVLMGFLASKIPSVSVNSAQVLKDCCMVGPSEFVDMFLEAIDVEVMLHNLASAKNETVLAMLELFKTLLNRNIKYWKAKDMGKYLDILQQMVGNRSEEVRLLVGAVVGKIATTCTPEKLLEYDRYMVASVLDLVSLLSSKSRSGYAVVPLGDLVSVSSHFQEVAIEVNAIPSLVKIFTESGNDNPDVLNTMAKLCEGHEKARRQVMDTPVVDALCNQLESSSKRNRMAACRCLHAVSRSMKALRVPNFRSKDTIRAILENIKDPDVELASCASSILVNLCIEPSSLRQSLLDEGAFDTFKLLIDSDGKLKCNGILGLGALAYMSGDSMKESISKALPWGTVVALLKDSDEEMTENILVLLRNMTHNSKKQSTWTKNWVKSDVLHLSEVVVKNYSTNKKLLVQSLYIAVNITSGIRHDRELVMKTEFYKRIPAFLESKDDEVREAAVWLVQNLASGADGQSLMASFLADNPQITSILRAMCNSETNSCIKDRVYILLDMSRGLHRILDSFREGGPSVEDNSMRVDHFDGNW